jgi:vancomycin resistance protein YoaR
MNWHSAALLAQALNIIFLQAAIAPPPVTQPESAMEADPAYTDILAQSSTSLFKNMPNRTDNILLACRLINQTVLMPGAAFSFNQTVGARTKEKGFKSAPTFLMGQVEDSIGGGICQVSSTLYYACLLADLEIVSRTNHSMYVDYFEEPGFDAAVSWGAIDFEFRNNTNNAIKIYSWVKDTTLYVRIAGTKINNNTVVMESKTLSTTPYKTLYRDNPHLPPGRKKVVQESHTGFVVETYRVLKEANGNIINRKLEAKSIYNKSDEIIEFNFQGRRVYTGER